MNVQDELEALKYLSSTHRKAHDGRRQYEWKWFLTVLTFFVLVAGLAFQDKIKLPGSWWFIAIVWIFLLLEAVLSSLFLLRIHIAHHRNRLCAEWAEDEIQDILKDENHKPNIEKLDSVRNKSFFPSSVKELAKELKKPTKTAAWPWTGQTLFILTFAVASAILITWRILQRS